MDKGVHAVELLSEIYRENPMIQKEAEMKRIIPLYTDRLLDLSIYCKKKSTYLSFFKNFIVF